MCAPSNAAIDEVILRLLPGVPDRKGKNKIVNIVRLGKPLECGDEQIRQRTLDNLMESVLIHEICYKNLLTVTNAYNALVDKRNNFGKTTEGETLKSIENELYTTRSNKIRLEMEVDLKKEKIRQKILENSDIVISTLSGSGHSVLYDHVKHYKSLFETVIVDEAAQCTEMSTLIPLRFGCRRLILVGDPQQLPPYCCDGKLICLIVFIVSISNDSYLLQLRQKKQDLEDRYLRD